MYEGLHGIFGEAFSQAAQGKGRDRHADDQNFDSQPIMWIEREFKSFQLGQAVKKLHESQRLEGEKAVAELLGAINYIAARIMFLREESGKEEPVEPVVYKSAPAAAKESCATCGIVDCTFNGSDQAACGRWVRK